MSDKPAGITLTVTLHPLGASALAKILDRARHRKLSHEVVDLMMPNELHEAEIALEVLCRALAEQGFDPQ